MVEAKKEKQPQVLSEVEFEKLVEDLEKFEDSFYCALAGTDRYEILPTMTEDGKVLTEEQISLIQRECNRLGLTILYRIDNIKNMVMVNSKTLKVGYVTDGIH